MEEKIVALFKAKGAMKAGEVAAELGIDKKDVDKAIKELVKAGKVESPKRCFYDIVK
ncbi:MAG: MarR family transcriptional regulator [Rikenellaceae bacterium]|nr:MarR family transcriptional regulator [Rikenellaceae bacterium]